MAGNNNSSSGTNRMAVPEAKDAMKRFEYYERLSKLDYKGE